MIIKLILILVLFQIKSLGAGEIDTNLLNEILPEQNLLKPMTDKNRNPYKKSERIIQPASNVSHDESPLSEQEKYSIDEIKFVGYVQKDGISTLMIKLPNEKVLFLRQGDKIGIERGKILSITGKKVSIEETQESGDTKEEKKIREIILED